MGNAKHRGQRQSCVGCGPGFLKSCGVRPKKSNGNEIFISGISPISTSTTTSARSFYAARCSVICRQVPTGSKPGSLGGNWVLHVTFKGHWVCPTPTTGILLKQAAITKTPPTFSLEAAPLFAPLYSLHWVLSGLSRCRQKCLGGGSRRRSCPARWLRH